MSNPSTSTVRSFVAIELPPHVRALLTTIQGELRDDLGGAAEAVRWVRPENTHLTLQFLGDVQVSKLPEIEQAIKQACEGAQPFNLNMDELGVFPNLRKPRVIWIGLEGSQKDLAALAALQQSVAEETKRLGFEPDKSFKPHLTLGRVREFASKSDLSTIADTLTYPEARPMFEAAFDVTSVKLIRSELRPEGPLYTELASVALG